MAVSDPNCRQAADDLVAILNTLRERELIKSPISDDTVRNSLNSCQPCRGKRPSSKKCLGWYGSFKGTNIIEVPFKIAKNEIVARLSGEFSFRRRPALKKSVGWKSAPTASASFAIELWKAASNELCARHHIDLANPDQDGPVWHLQLGGLAASEDRHKELEWLDVPRWPALPMDMVLVLELAIYNFHYETWKDLRTTNPWRNIVKRSEELMFDHYFKRLDGYRNQGEAGHSWLAHQCNRTSGWNPRPV